MQPKLNARQRLAIRSAVIVRGPNAGPRHVPVKYDFYDSASQTHYWYARGCKHEFYAEDQLTAFSTTPVDGCE